MMYRLRAFGGLVLERDGVRLDGVAGHRKALSLLAALAVHGSLGRERLMALLWPESDAERAKGSLKQAIHLLRRQLAEPDLLVGTAELRLNPDRIESDVQLFTRALEAGDAEAAVALYEGPFLDGVHLDGTPEFERWADERRAELAGRHARALEELARGAEARDDPLGAAGWWRRLQAADPFNGRVALHLMRALEAAGDRAAALRHADAHDLLLREELGIAADATILELAEQLRSPATPGPAGASPTAGAPDRPVPPRPASPPPASGSPPASAPARSPAPDPDAHPAAPAPATPRLRRGFRIAGLFLATALAIGVGVMASAGERLMGDAGGGGTDGGDEEGPPLAVPAPARTEIAVLPFQNLSADGPHAYFAAGLHDELLTQLSKVGALTVISRTSVMAYEGTRTPLRQIAAELRVGSVLEGTVQVLDGRLRVNVQLIDAATDAHVWANRYDRPLEDAFAVQSDIAQQIATAVGASLSHDEERRLAEAPTPNTEAYHLYLQARAYLVAPTGDMWQSHGIAQQLLEQALALEPEFVLAHVELSVVHGRMYWGRLDATPARAALQWEAAETALQLAPHLPEAQFAMGLAHYWGRRDYEHALEWFARGLAGSANDHRLLTFTGLVHRRLGNWDQALTAFEHAARLDPRGQIDPDGVGNTLGIQRRYGEAVRVYDRFLRLRPDASGVRLWKAMTYLDWEGQLDSLRAVVSHLPADRGLGGLGNRTAQHLRLLFLERQADSLLYLLGTTDTRTLEGQFSFVPAALYAAWAHRMHGDHRAARAEFDSARMLLDSVVLRQPDDPRVHAARGLALAGLGRRAEALQEARWLEQSELYRNDAYEGPAWAVQRARILAQVGDAEAALDEIEGLLSRPSWLSVHMLRLDPLLDPIRGHPRFQALVSSDR
jgi:TolB-like protein/DNA-binding SARP family transcriptional activator/Flp pilus assembly protein TadD